MEIRELKKSDFNKVIGLMESYKKESDKLFKSEDQTNTLKQLKTIYKESRGFNLVAEENSKIVGYINAHLIPFTLLMGKECYVSCLLVDKEKRGQSIGSTLLKHIEDKAKKEGCIRLMLNNPKESLSYKKGFYAREGFIQRDNFANFVKNL